MQNTTTSKVTIPFGFVYEGMPVKGDLRVADITRSGSAIGFNLVDARGVFSTVGGITTALLTVER